MPSSEKLVNSTTRIYEIVHAMGITNFMDSSGHVEILVTGKEGYPVYKNELILKGQSAVYIRDYDTGVPPLVPFAEYARFKGKNIEEKTSEYLRKNIYILLKEGFFLEKILGDHSGEMVMTFGTTRPQSYSRNKFINRGKLTFMVDEDLKEAWLIGIEISFNGFKAKITDLPHRSGLQLRRDGELAILTMALRVPQEQMDA